MIFSDSKTDKIMMDLRICAKGDIEIVDMAMVMALREAQRLGKKTVNPERIKEFINMRFPFNTSSPVMKELLDYAEGDEELLEQAMHYAYQRTVKGPVQIITIIEEVHRLQHLEQKSEVIPMEEFHKGK